MSTFRTGRVNAPSREWLEDLRPLESNRRRAARHHMLLSAFIWGGVLGFLLGMIVG